LCTYLCLLFKDFYELDFNLKVNSIVWLPWVIIKSIVLSLFSYLDDVIMLVFLKSNSRIKHLNINFRHESTGIVSSSECSSKSYIVWNCSPIFYKRNIWITINSKEIKIIELLKDCIVRDICTIDTKRLKCILIWNFYVTLNCSIYPKLDTLIWCHINSTKNLWALPTCRISPRF